MQHTSGWIPGGLVGGIDVEEDLQTRVGGRDDDRIRRRDDNWASGRGGSCVGGREGVAAGEFASAVDAAMDSSFSSTTA